jgi:hypothetical protein
MARGTRALTLSDGEPREMRFTFGTLERIRERAGIELEDFRDKARMAQLVTRNLPLFIWAALTAEYRDRIRPDEIGDLIDFEDLPRITEQLMAAMGGGPEHPMPAAAEAPAAAVNGSPSNGAEQSLEFTGDLVTVSSGG